ncbi:hypothetical protein [Xanthomonas sp. XNM01]|uniref:hypothetical protein n=1 Tax=Xanthomonas sp. XNM01 TaxID=2769289 RepID=UPI00177D3614|nr:hypothetical protein [Xanthomonas sp. XNM01]MBD9368785.1 hypothetical protein [Xanthomonas sp. XNM01]
MEETLDDGYGANGSAIDVHTRQRIHLLSLQREAAPSTTSRPAINPLHRNRDRAGRATSPLTAFVVKRCTAMMVVDDPYKLQVTRGAAADNPACHGGRGLRHLKTRGRVQAELDRFSPPSRACHPLAAYPQRD